MGSTHDSIALNLELLRKELEDFIHFYQKGLDYHLMVYALWNAKDILGHITFWHESFARNISDLGEGIKPSPLKGKLSEVNRASVGTTKNVSVTDLIDRLKKAQQIVERYIFMEEIDLIPYKKGSRDYSREEHLLIVAQHIRRHLKDLKKIYKTHLR